MKYAAMLVLALAMVGCGGSGGGGGAAPPPEPPIILDRDYVIRGDGLSVTVPDGLIYSVIVIGNGNRVNVADTTQVAARLQMYGNNNVIGIPPAPWCPMIGVHSEGDGNSVFVGVAYAPPIPMATN